MLKFQCCGKLNGKQENVLHLFSRMICNSLDVEGAIMVVSGHSREWRDVFRVNSDKLFKHGHEKFKYRI